MTDQEAGEISTAGALLLGLLNGFSWIDEGLQNYMRSRGWPSVTRPQSMVMAIIVMGVVHPSDIARRLGLTRQAVHKTLRSMIELDMISLVADPSNKRVKIVELTETGLAMRKDSGDAVRLILLLLNDRLGTKRVKDAIDVLSDDWGEIPTFDTDVSTGQ
ncbi:MarR family winged helix-turn-helix transcriptional regulator [Hyphomonas sp.]|uniref:MarR family winged helix-turn-helix transcriptional regulator n=1 Tax=Hyphomonas sp. TaxID=87 RepID=UPI00352984B5